MRVHQPFDRRVPAETHVAHEYVLNRHPPRRNDGKAKFAVVDHDDLDTFLLASVEDVFAHRPGDGTIRRNVAALNARGFLINILLDICNNQTKWFGGLGGGHSRDKQHNGRQL